MASLIIIRERLQIKRDRLALYLKAEEAILDGAQSYTIGSRQLSRASLADIRSEIRKLEDDIASLEAQLEGRKPRKAFAVLPRDF